MATKPNARPRRRAAESPGAGVSGIEDDLKTRAAEAAQKATQIAEQQGQRSAPAADAAPGSGVAQNSVPTQQQAELTSAAPESAVAEPTDNTKATAPEQASRNPEIQKSGQTSGNPENQNSGIAPEGMPAGSEAQPSDYLGMVYEGVTDPFEDFRKGSTQLPLVVWRTAKAAAPIHGVSVQRLLTDILLGKVKPLPESHPDLLDRFYRMAQQGKLK